MRRDASCASPHGQTRSWSRRSAKRPSARSPGRGRGRGRISEPSARGADRSGHRAEVLVELGLAERRTNGPAAADHLGAGSSSSPTGRGAARSRSSWPALWFTDRIGDALAVCQQALDEVDRQRDPDLYELLVAELISSAWWDGRPIHRPSNDRRARPGCAPRWPRQRDPARDDGALRVPAVPAPRARNRARQASARAREPVGERLDRFLLAAMALPQSGLLHEAVSIFDHAVAQALGAGHLQRPFMLMWRGYCQTRSRRPSSSGRRSAGGDGSLRRPRDARRLAVQHRIPGACAAGAGGDGRGGRRDRPG